MQNFFLKVWCRRQVIGRVWRRSSLWQAQTRPAGDIAVHPKYVLEFPFVGYACSHQHTRLVLGNGLIRGCLTPRWINGPARRAVAPPTMAIHTFANRSLGSMYRVRLSSGSRKRFPLPNAWCSFVLICQRHIKRIAVVMSYSLFFTSEVNGALRLTFLSYPWFFFISRTASSALCGLLEDLNLQGIH